MSGETDRDTHIGESVLEDEVPADDPGDELAERGVGVGVGRAGDGDHTGQLGVAKAGEAADDGDQHHRERQRGAGAGAAAEAGEVVVQRADDEVDHRGFGQLVRRGAATDRGADDGEDARPDDGADA